jgi:hypothetical protein
MLLVGVNRGPGRAAPLAHVAASGPGSWIASPCRLRQRVLLSALAPGTQVGRMQTFLPYPDIRASLACLDDRRLGKQRAEALQVLRALAAEREDRPYGWRRHPVTRMWRGHDDLLAAYLNAALDEWQGRGFRNAMPRIILPAAGVRLPPWWGDQRLHGSHRSALLRKHPAHYGRFGWREPPDLTYFWPVASPPCRGPASGSSAP